MTIGEIKFIVKTEAFHEWAYNMHHRFQQMVQTMVDIYSVIQTTMNKKQLIPLDFGNLERSFRYDLVRDDEFELEMHYVFDAIDPKYGFHYAEYQHELDPRGIGTYSYYSRALAGFPVDPHHRQGTRGGAFYLLKGVEGSETMMWKLLEQDYMSLFQGGIK